MTKSPTPLSRLSRWLWWSCLLLLVGCSDFLGIDEFDDQGTAVGERPSDGDDPSAEGVDPGDELTGALMWWAAFGDTGPDGVTAVAPLDDAVQLAGRIDGAVSFGGGAVGSAGPQAFVARFDLDGEHLWSIATTGSGLVERIEVDTSGDDGAVIAGTYRGALTLSGHALPAAPNGDPSLFVAWLSSDGEVTRVTAFPSSGELEVASVAVAPNDDVAVVGAITGTIEVGPVVLAGSTFEQDALLIVLDGDGAPKLATNLRTADDTRDQRLSVARYAPDGALWIGGSFRGALAFDGAPLTSVGASDGLVARVELGSTLESVTVVDQLLLGGGQSEVDVTSLHLGEELTLGGTYSDALVLGDDELESHGDRDLFVARLSLDLVPVWAAALGSAGPESLRALDVDDHGHTTCTGSFSSDLWSELGVVATSHGEQDAFVAKLDEEGALRWTRAFGRQGEDVGHGLAVDHDGHALVAGSFTDGLMLDEELLESVGLQDAYVLRLDR